MIMTPAMVSRARRLARPVVLVLCLLSGVAGEAGAGALAVSWTDYAVDEDGFLVERRLAAGGVFEQVAVQAANAQAFFDRGVAAGGTYCYRVRSFNALGTSPYSDEGCGTAVATESPVVVTLDRTVYRQSDSMIATVQSLGDFAAAVDVYVIVQVPGGTLSLQLDGRLVPGLVPLVRNIVPPTMAAPFTFPLATAPPGTYTWMAGVTAPGTLTTVAPLSTTTFTVTP